MPLNDRQPKTSLVIPILLITIGALFLCKTWYPSIPERNLVGQHKSFRAAG